MWNHRRHFVPPATIFQALFAKKRSLTPWFGCIERREPTLMRREIAAFTRRTTTALAVFAPDQSRVSHAGSRKIREWLLLHGCGCRIADSVSSIHL
jgi:hypothetical protein